MFATYDDLVSRFDKKKIDEVSQYAEFDTLLNDYIVVTDQTKLQERAELALKDACTELRRVLSCCYDLACIDQLISDGNIFPDLKLFNVKLAYHMLKNQSSDCEDCKKCITDFKDFCDCTQICSDLTDPLNTATEMNCLEKKSCFAVEEKSVCIPSMCDICCTTECQCCDGGVAP